MVERKRVRAAVVEEKPAVVPVATEKTDETPIVLTRFRKLGGGSLYLNKHIIKSGQVFSYDKNKIPIHFLDTLEVISQGNEVPSGAIKVSVVLPVARYEAKKANDGSYTIVNNKTGKTISTGKLTEAEVNALIKNLNG